jgi:hypothetical protein
MGNLSTVSCALGTLIYLGTSFWRHTGKYHLIWLLRYHADEVEVKLIRDILLFYDTLLRRNIFADHQRRLVLLGSLFTIACCLCVSVICVTSVSF